MSTFLVVRHAEKADGEFYNPYLRHQDQPITPSGRQRAERLLSFVGNRRPSSIYISEYLRTRQTAEYVAAQLGLCPVVEKRLNEVDNGAIEGLSDEEIRSNYPDVWNGFRQADHDFRFPGGESGEEARGRIMGLLEEKWLRHQSEAVVFVCHEGLIRIMVCAILGLPVYARWRFSVDFCGITEIAFQPEARKWKLIRFNSIVE